MTLVLALDQIAYIHKEAAAKDESLSEVARKLVQIGIDASAESDQPGAPIREQALGREAVTA
jgi:hypothetical protein